MPLGKFPKLNDVVEQHTQTSGASANARQYANLLGVQGLLRVDAREMAASIMTAAAPVIQLYMQ